MKKRTILILTTVASALVASCKPCRAQELSDWIVNGPAISGKITHVHQKDQLTHRLNMVQMKVFNHPIQASTKMYNLKALTGTDEGRWVINRSDIVKTGRHGITKATTLMPNYTYGIDYALSIYGCIENKGFDTLSFGDGIDFVYDDPFYSFPIYEYLNGILTLDHTQSIKNKKVYDADLVFKDRDKKGHGPFQASLTGKITFSNITLRVDDIDYEGIAATLDLSAKNCTKAQIVNFTQWWCNCVVPSIY